MPVVSAVSNPTAIALYKKWWPWTIAGAVVLAGVAVGVGVGLAAASATPDCPDCAYGVLRPF